MKTKNCYFGSAFAGHLLCALLMVSALPSIEAGAQTNGDSGTAARSTQSAPKLTGVVVDAEGLPLPGVHVQTNDPTVAGVTDINGLFNIHIPAGKTVRNVTFSFMGMQTKTVTFNGRELKITLIEDTNALQEVVVTGMFERRKESFTGSSVTFTNEDLKTVGNQNLLKSLKVLDPVFQIVENLEMGSDPNSMPNIQLRGETSFNIQGDYDGNANQPLFILDGFETTLEKIWDLDMNRVQSVTLLKDATAKAIYGSKAGNGVVVIETIRPKTGEMRISYNGDLNLELPDLSGYNLMNAQEKYDWEVAHGKYDRLQADLNPTAADLLNKSVYDAIYSGVDAYWLNKPLRTGVGQKHSLALEGGDSRIRYILGGSFNDVEGAMKGSDRRTLNINSTLSYTYKNMVFRNQIDYTNGNSKNSPYGAFSNYVGLEPYFAPYDADGNLKKILGYECVNRDGTFSSPVYNPLYNATLNTKNVSDYKTFTDNFDMDWRVSERFRFTAKLSYTEQSNGSDVFYPANHTMFIDYDANGLSDRKGLYTKSNGGMKSFTAQAGINYNQTFGKHAIFLNGTWNLQSTDSKSTTVRAEGFGNDNMDDISMATSYYHSSHPFGSDSRTREVGLIGAFNYSYADRYLFDASIRCTGSSVYGSDNHWGNFWSLGAGWNIHKESWMADSLPLVKRLQLRYSLGYTGTQNFNPYQSRAKYQYGSVFYDGHLGATIMGIPNTGLRWQRVYDNNIGLDLALGSFLTGRVDYYIQNTDNMLTDITLPSSAGFNLYKENMGEIRNNGVEFSLGVTPYRDNSSRSWVSLTFSGYHNRNRISKIYDIFKKNNEDADAELNKGLSTGSPTPEEAAAYMARTTRPATKFYEGCSMTAIWGVRSLGIDPVSGNEMYLDKNDKVTYTWNSDDQVVIGDTNPLMRGAFGVSGGWHGWTLSVHATYKFGGELYNTTLVDRVENITGFGNLDKRVAQTWLKPGDEAAFRYVRMLQTPTSMMDFITTRPTSRFVQKDNEIYLSTINIGYDFYKVAWLSKAGIDRLKLSIYANNLCRLSSIKVERGTSYPFARNLSFAVNVTF
ncbi:MAG: SusC/RagA family TonB-linked outer membrane protein [Bacteroidales bacterium]|nr:SusC/RagA family TonB-linked outer membrane protein [Bacteroidales bacterium]